MRPSFGPTMISAPLSHISLTSVLRAIDVGRDDNMKADRAKTPVPSERCILLSSWNDFCHEALRLPISTPVTDSTIKCIRTVGKESRCANTLYQSTSNFDKAVALVDA